MAIGTQIRHYRLKAGWLLKELSARSGVEIGTLSALENRNSSKSDFFQPIAAAFGLTVEQLADETTDHALVPLLNAPRAPLQLVPRSAPCSEFARVLADAFDSLPDDLALRAETFTALLKLLTEAKAGQPGGSPAATPWPLETAEKQS